ncbi:MAG: hypothetical protein KME21_17450 [Desmonostoc vinosum HA7617-LM4]|nr:hypothetical protein [Desmonostoc vinosum HA7617-LM4]
MKRAVLRVNGKPVERSQRQMNLLLDTFIVEYFEAKAGEQGVQGLAWASSGDCSYRNWR